MSRFIQPLPFSPHYDFVAARVVTINGQNLVPGDPVDTSDLSVRRLRQMYENRMITPVAPASLAGIASAQEPAQAAQEPDGEPEATDTQDEPVEATDEAPLPAVGGKTVEHRGFGRYYVLDADGTEIAGPLSKAAANAMLEASPCP